MLAVIRIAGAALGWAAWLVGIRRAVTQDNIHRAYPDLIEGARQRIARRAFMNLGIVFFEFLYLRIASRAAIHNSLRINNLVEVRNALSSPNGVILLSGHLGNWEWLALSFALQIERPISLIVKNQKSSYAERFLTRMRTRFGNRQIDAGDVRKIFRALKNGEPLAILGDQTAFAEAVRVPFFGIEVPTFEGTARLALATRSPIIFFQPLGRTVLGYECHLHSVPFDDLIEVSEQNVKILTARHTAVLEAAIREKPELWLWQHKRFKYV